jgi:hypothetical protein
MSAFDGSGVPGAMGRVSFEGIFDESDDHESPLVYRIRRTDKAGFMSTMGTVLTQLAVAKWLGALPVVDLTEGSAYQERQAINGTRNVWEYYFLPVSPVRLDDLGSPEYRVVNSETHHPILKVEGEEKWLGKLWKQFVTFNSETENYLENRLESLALGPNVVGVHARSGDMKTFPGHPLPPTIEQLVEGARSLLNTANFDSVFLAAQDHKDVRVMKKEFGGRLKVSPSFVFSTRSDKMGTPYSGLTSNKMVSYAEAIRPLHFYELGREVLHDVLALSRCGSLVSGESNVAKWARIVRGTEFDAAVNISNGWNSHNKFVSAVLFQVRAVAPTFLGGFRRGFQ